MSPLLRTILFWMFALGFLISAPLIVLYTAGYRYKFGSVGVYKTGVLSVNSTPRGATVFIDENAMNERTPSVIDNLPPGSQKIRVEKSGYSSWKKMLPIESGKSTFISNLVLFLEEKPFQAIKTTSVVESASFNGSRFAYLTQSNDLLELWVRDPLFLGDRRVYKQLPRSATAYLIIWSPDGEYILLKEQGNAERNTVIRFRDATIIKPPVKDVATFSWDFGTEHTLLYNAQKELRAFGIDNDVVFPKKLVAQSARHSDGRVLVVQSNQQSTVSYLDPSGLATILAYLPLGEYRFVPTSSPYVALEETTRHHFLLLDTNKKEPLIFDEEVIFFEWSPTLQQLLFSNGFDIKIWSAATGTIKTVTRFSEPITQLAWYPLGDILLYSQRSVIKAIELDDRDQRNETILIGQMPVENFWLTDDGGSLFLESDGKILEKRLQK